MYYVLLQNSFQKTTKKSALRFLTSLDNNFSHKCDFKFHVIGGNGLICLFLIYRPTYPNVANVRGGGGWVDLAPTPAPTVRNATVAPGKTTSFSWPFISSQF